MMDTSYIDQSLMKDEKVIYRTHPHWIIFAPTIGWVIAMCASLMVLPLFKIGELTIGNSHPIYLICAYLCLLAATITGVISYTIYRTSEYGITNKRVIVKIGFIQRSTLEILLPRIESIQIFQTILGRILNYGTIVISGTGGSRDAFRTMPNPMRFHLIAQEQAEIQSKLNQSGS
jgi:uncharacterized membrane protein YdbT with pleckstrin-like domain